jgi:hypothetical protein
VNDRLPYVDASNRFADLMCTLCGALIGNTALHSEWHHLELEHAKEIQTTLNELLARTEP